VFPDPPVNRFASATSLPVGRGSETERHDSLSPAWHVTEVSELLAQIPGSGNVIPQAPPAVGKSILAFGSQSYVAGNGSHTRLHVPVRKRLFKCTAAGSLVHCFCAFFGCRTRADRPPRASDRCPPGALDVAIVVFSLQEAQFSLETGGHSVHLPPLVSRRSCSACSAGFVWSICWLGRTPHGV
jgi:hypothetical protein